MIYRTLHAYILRELLRVFVLTASTLTTLLAFGGMFRPLTRQGVDVSQVMVLMLNLMPAMLAYAIPIAALFAAVLVYWRMSTDNELTACRAGGVSFMAIVAPAFALGLAVAMMDAMFVNYVVPHFLQTTERAVRSDIASLIVNQINRQEKFQYDPLPIVVTADYAEETPSTDPNVSTVVLHGAAGTFLDSHGKPTAIGVAQEATVTIRNLPDEDAAEVSFSLRNGSGFDPNNGFRKGTGSIETVPWTRKFPSVVKSKAKYLNLPDLWKLDKNPALFPPVGDVVDKIEVAHRYVEISENIQQWWFQNSTAERGVVFAVSDPSSNKMDATLYAPLSQIDPGASPEECLNFLGRNPGSVKLELRRGGKLETTFRCDRAELILAFDQFTGTTVSGQIRLRGTVTRENNDAGAKPDPEASPFLISGLVIPDVAMGTTRYTDDDREAQAELLKTVPGNGAVLILSDESSSAGWTAFCAGHGWQSTVLSPKEGHPLSDAQVSEALKSRPFAAMLVVEPGKTVAPLVEDRERLTSLAIGLHTPVISVGKYVLVSFATKSANASLHKVGDSAEDAITRFYQTLLSELNSRASFAASCLMLVLLGAALGILLRGKNPLAVFVVGFVPAIVLVLLITAGRQLTEGGPQHTVAGVTTIWAGNAILLALVAGVYANLLRR